MRTRYPDDISYLPRPQPPPYLEGVFVGQPISGDSTLRAYVSTERGEHKGPPAERSSAQCSSMKQDPDSKVEGELSPIVRETLDAPALRSLDPGNSSLQHALDMLETLASWEPHMLVDWKSIPQGFNRGTSRRMKQHLARMTSYCVVRDIRQKDIRVVTNFFCVAKKDLTLRLVVDGRKTNALMAPPPPMNLPHIHEVVAYLMTNEFALTVDGISYFYQFGISDEVGTMFATNLSGTRGDFVPVAMTRMPMGWSYAPYTAQLASATLLKGKDGRTLGIAWIDNFIFAGKTSEEVMANFLEFRDRCDVCNIRIDNREPVPSRTLTALGIDFDLEGKSYALNTEWVAKKKDMRARSIMTPREVYEMTGTAIWHDFVKTVPLCHQESCIEIVRRVASMMSQKADWDTPIRLADAEVHDLNLWLDTVLVNTPASWKPKAEVELDLWTDAADAAWAALVVEFDILIAGEQGTFSDDARKWHIFLKEAYAADKVLTATKGIPRRIHIDNKPLVQCIDRGFSSNKFVNGLIRKWDLPNITPEWVPTTKELADPFTRGVRLRDDVPPLSDVEGQRRQRGQHTLFQSTSDLRKILESFAVEKTSLKR